MTESFQMVICGHLHIPSVREQNGVIYLNSGSAGPRRFNIPTSVARGVSTTGMNVRIVRLEIGTATTKKSILK